jgi:ATP-dependent helicase/nuclease subunit A
VNWDERAEEEKKYEEAEETRLMYVAATRARNLMVISTYEGDISNKRAWKALDDELGGVPELEIPEKAAVQEREKLVLRGGELEKARGKLKGNIDAAIRPSYLVESVTSLAKKEKELPGWRKSGFGMSWGRVVHNILEVAGKGGDEKLDLLAENALVAEGRDAGEKGKLLRLIDSILKSDFWQRIMKAEKRYFEIPFSIKTDSKVLPAGEWEERSERGAKAKKEKLPIILTGAIDLAFFEQDGWIIADYKTDEVGERLENFVKYYGSQVKLYSKYWEEITKQKVKEAGLYFTSIDKWVKIYP